MEPLEPGISVGVEAGSEGFAVSTASAAAHAAEIGAEHDEAIAGAVRRELASDSMTSALALDVSVSGGFVRLYGSVPDVEHAEAAEEVAYRVEGVVVAIADVTAEVA